MRELAGQLDYFTDKLYRSFDLMLPQVKVKLRHRERNTPHKSDELIILEINYKKF